MSPGSVLLPSRDMVGVYPKMSPLYLITGLNLEFPCSAQLTTMVVLTSLYLRAIPISKHLESSFEISLDVWIGIAQDGERIV